MDCDICMESFDAGDRRPKLLPCGHTYCLSCVSRQEKKCPVDRKTFRTSPDKLPDNYKLIELSQRPLSVYGWCRFCAAGATEACLDEHTSSICSLKKARIETIQPRLDAIAEAEKALTGMTRMIEDSAADVGALVTQCCDQLGREQTALGEARKSLEAALSMEAAVWVKKEKPEAEGTQEHVLSAGAARLLADLAEPSTVCEVRVSAGPGPGPGPGPVAWRGCLRPQRDAAARLSLCRLLCEGELHLLEEQAQPGAKVLDCVPLPPLDMDGGAGLPAGWEERSNEVELSVEEMLAAVRPGSRVARGAGWRPTWTADGGADKEGVVTAVVDRGRVRVRWSEHGAEFVYAMSPAQQHLRLVPFQPKFPLPRKDVASLDLSEISVKNSLQRSLPTARLAEAKAIFGVRCDLAPNWSMKVLRSVAGHVEGLSLVSAQQQHLKAACDCVRLRTLHLCGRPVLVGPVVDLTLDAAGSSTSAPQAPPRDPPVPQDPVDEAHEVAPLPPGLEELRITCVIREQLMQVHRLVNLRRLEVHSPFDAPLPNVNMPAVGAPGLLWLRAGLYPLATALALVRAHAASLHVLELVAASSHPYGCPDLAAQLGRCGLQVLQRLVLWRGSVGGKFCRHEAAECKSQKRSLMVALGNVIVLCSDCDQVALF